ncbi:DUF4267 domain-containing protein [Sphingomonas sp. Marseille-Q8236]
MCRRSAFLILTGLFSAVFVALGAAFICLPEPASAFYGIPSRDPAALLYVRAIGFRDLAVSAYLMGLMALGRLRALIIILAATIVIPIGDMALLILSGSGRGIHYFLHGASLFCFAALALWGHRLARSSA